MEDNRENMLNAENAKVAEESERINRTTREIIGAAIEVHRGLGPGLLESAYETCLYHELTVRGLKVERQKPLPIAYRGVRLDCGYRMDLLVEVSVRPFLVIRLTRANSATFRA